MHVKAGHAFTHSVGWVQGTLSTRLRQSTSTRGWWVIVIRRRGDGRSFVAPYIPALYIGTNNEVFRSLFVLILMFQTFLLSWWKPMDGPWATIWWDVRAYRSAFPCIGLLEVLSRKQWSFTEALTNQLPQVIYLRYVTVWNQLPRDRGGVTSTDWTIGGKFSYYYMSWTFPSEISLGSASDWSTDGGTGLRLNLCHIGRVIWRLSMRCLAGWASTWVSMPKGASRNMYLQ